MTISLGIVMDPIAAISFKKDTSLALLQAAQAKGWSLHYMEMDDLFLQNDIAKAQTRPLTVFNDPEHWFELGEPVTRALGELDVILMRKDPPFDSPFLHSTYILEAAQRQGCMVVNDPRSLRDCNEKLFATEFPQCCPPLIVSNKASILRDFHKAHDDVIFKPLDGMGGSRIFRCKADDPNVSVVLETLTEDNKEYVMAQQFIPDISNGDKRILMVDGEPIPYGLARIPAKGETRGNLAAGGRGEARPLTERDLWIAAQVAPALKARNLLFVGLDVIGDYLTEINVTSPTCAREIDAAYDTQIGEKLMHAIEQRLPSR